MDSLQVSLSLPFPNERLGVYLPQSLGFQVRVSSGHVPFLLTCYVCSKPSTALRAPEQQHLSRQSGPVHSLILSKHQPENDRSYVLLRLSLESPRVKTFLHMLLNRSSINYLRHTYYMHCIRLGAGDTVINKIDLHSPGSPGSYLERQIASVHGTVQSSEEARPNWRTSHLSQLSFSSLI